MDENRPWRPQDADKEFIRQRVRNASADPNAKFIPAKPKPSIKDDEQKNVAVYARVSTKSTEQVSSIENQTKYYTEKVEKTPNWTLTDIYSDEGKSGTSMTKRTEFQRMMKDAKDKSMDLIICASVSRFARNVSDCVEQVRTLRTMNPQHPVGVYFETEDIYTLDPDCDQMFKMHAMLADWESANKSRRMILSYDQRICTGQYPVSDLLGYRHTKDGNLVIQEDEAKTVRFIFLAYICGFTSDDIAKTLTDKKRPTLTGRTDWNAGMVRNILENERRWGDLSARKTVVVDYVKRTIVKNTQIRDAAFVPKHHKGIVTPEIAKAAQTAAACSLKLCGASEIAVISEGALKGFVCISPYWNAINANIFYDISKSVYNTYEFNQLKHDAAIMNGTEHSKVLSMQFNDYHVPYGVYFLNNSTASMTLSQTTITFNKAAHKKLGNSKYIEILYHPILQAIVIRTCEFPTSNTIVWDDNGISTTKITANSFCTSIYANMNWIKEYRFKFKGIFRQRGHAKMLIFFLDEPQIIVGKNTKKAADYSVQYITYKSADSSADGTKHMDEGNHTYPTHLDSLGLSLALRAKRDRLIDNITENDITADGIKVDNPLIGKIPTRSEVEQELRQLLASM